ncbi:MAG: energy transducer TonB [Thermodesulfobacteriota bacterium]|nr:energy transducer TonB [Thermodesulfobacteriota bacterium]
MSNRKPNWLLRSLIGFSACIHLLLFLHVSGIYTSNALSYIELTVEDLSKPFSRSIPRPRHRPKTPPEQQDIKRLQATQPVIPRLKPPKMEPVERAEPESLVEPIATPNIPAMPKLDVASWDPVDLTQNAVDYATSRSYFDMVRFQVERHKQYPDTARLRQIEGEVVIRFVITPKGEVQALTLAKASGCCALDDAALRAVRDAAPFPKPPRQLFRGEIPLELTMVFELT